MQRALSYKRGKIIVPYNLVNICNQYKFNVTFNVDPCYTEITNNFRIIVPDIFRA